MTTKAGKLPGPYVQFQDNYPELFTAYEQLGMAAAKQGPLSEKEVHLVRLATASGARLQGAVHAHCRRALEAGITADEIRHAVILSVTTLGFPSMMATLTWIEDVFAEGPKTK